MDLWSTTMYNREIWHWPLIELELIGRAIHGY